MKTLLFVKQLMGLAQPDRKTLSLLVILTAVGEAVAVPIPFLFAWIIERFRAGVTTEDFIIFVLLTVILNVAGAVLGIYRVRLNRRFALGAANRMRSDFFEHLLRLPYAHFLENNAGGQANNYLNDIDDVDQSVASLIDVGLRCVFMLLFYGIAIVLWNPIIGLLAVTIMPVTVYLQRNMRERVKEMSRERVDLREQLVGRVSEAMAGVTVVKAYGMQGLLRRRFGALSADFRDVAILLATYQSALRSAATVLLIFTQYSFFVVGAWMVTVGRLAVGPFLGQMVMVVKFVRPLEELLDYVNQLASAESALRRVNRILKKPREGASYDRSITSLPRLEGGVHLQIDDLHFRYNEDLPLIEGWSFEAKPGQTVAIVGPSGSGKTTLFNLVLGLFDQFDGRISINEQDIREVELPVLREQMGVVFQEHILFNATVRDNLLIALSEEDAAKASDELLWDALNLAHAEDFIRGLPKGLDTLVGVQGVKLSGGQRQRLALARVILKNPPLLLLDEATSALDSISESHIQQALNRLFEDRTSLVIAHRLSTITKADMILVIDDGRILERGTHGELVAAGGVYARLHEAQVSGFIHWDTTPDDAKGDDDE